MTYICFLHNVYYYYFFLLFREIIPLNILSFHCVYHFRKNWSHFVKLLSQIANTIFQLLCKKHTQTRAPPDLQMVLSLLLFAINCVRNVYLVVLCFFFLFALFIGIYFGWWWVCVYVGWNGGGGGGLNV